MDTDNTYGNLSFHKKYLTDIKAFHEYCKCYGIKYSLSGGTLLGAIRHKGFIPWDDDMDVMFSRLEYNNFLSTMKNHPLEGYEVFYGNSWVNRFTAKDNPLKEQELQCIDLFVFDNVPQRELVDKMKVFMLKTIQGMIKGNVDYQDYPFRYRLSLLITHFLGLFFPKNLKIKAYDSVSKIGKKSGKIRVYNIFFSLLGKNTFSETLLDEYTTVSFEGIELMSISRHHEYLTTLYGDYMTPPKMGERKPSHRNDE